MLQPKIVAFGHQKNVGKDELFKYCMDILRPQTRALRIIRRGFADKLYDFCHAMYGWAGFRPREYYVRHPSAKSDLLETGVTVRDLLIKMGNFLRQFDAPIWINGNIKAGDFDILFITDLRFPNEFDAVEKLGGHLIRVTRPNLPVPTDEADTALNGWEDRWHDLVENNECLSKLYKEAERIVHRYILTSPLLQTGLST